MKKTFNLMGFFLLTMLIFSGCNKVKDLTTVNFDANFSTNLDCVVPPSARAVVPTFSASAVIDPTSDPNVNLYLNNIDGYEVQSINATVTSISQENVTLVSGDLIIQNFQSNAQWSFQNELLNVGKTFVLGNENGQWNTVNSILKDGQEFTVLITGETDFADVTFTIHVDIVTKVSASPL